MPSKTYTKAQQAYDQQQAHIYDQVKHSPLLRLEHFSAAEPRAVYLHHLLAKENESPGAWYPMLGGRYLVSASTQGFASHAGAVAEATEQRDKQREKLARYKAQLVTTDDNPLV